MKRIFFYENWDNLLAMKDILVGYIFFINSKQSQGYKNHNHGYVSLKKVKIHGWKRGKKSWNENFVKISHISQVYIKIWPCYNFSIDFMSSVMKLCILKSVSSLINLIYK